MHVPDDISFFFIFKAHCPFLHDKPKDVPITETLKAIKKTDQYSSYSSISPEISKQANSLDTSLPANVPNAPKIIVNRKKIEELKNNHVIPQNIKTFVPVTSPFLQAEIEDPNQKRVVLPPKSRLGTRKDVTHGLLGTKRSIKDRLGTVFDPNLQNCQIYELDEGDSFIEDIDEHYTSNEEKYLREGAIKTIDLRNRLSKKDNVLREYDNQFSVSSEVRIKSNVNFKDTEPSSPIDSELEDYSDEGDCQNVISVKKSKKPKVKKEKKKKKDKSKEKEHKLIKLKGKKAKADKNKKKKSDKNLHPSYEDVNTESTYQNSFATKIATKRNKTLSQIKSSEDDEISSLEEYMHTIKEKKLKVSRHKTNETHLLVKNKRIIGESKADKQKTLKTDNKSVGTITTIRSTLSKTNMHKTARKVKLQNKKRMYENDTSTLVPNSKSEDNGKKAKILKNISKAVVQKKESVRSILNDVDSLLQASGNQNLGTKSNLQNTVEESEDVMKQLEEIINS